MFWLRSVAIPILSSPQATKMATLASPIATPRLAPSRLTLSLQSPGLPRPALNRTESQIMYYLKAIATFSKLSSSSSASSQNLVLERGSAELGRVKNKGIWIRYN